MNAFDRSDIRVVLYEPKSQDREIARYALNEIGFGNVQDCAHYRELKFQCAAGDTDLLLMDLDESLEEICAIMRKIRNHELGIDPFVVAIATTWEADWDTVRTALQAGVDDILVKPMSVALLNGRISNMIHHRRDFVATTDYVGPERRRPARTVDGVRQIRVPNSLRFKATGDPEAAVDEAAVRRSLDAIALQKAQRVCDEITRLATELTILAAHGRVTFVDKIETAAGLISEVGSFVAGRARPGVDRMVQSMTGVIDGIKRTEAPSDRQFEVLKLHGQAIGNALQQDSGEADKLAKALSRLVKVAKK